MSIEHKAAKLLQGWIQYRDDNTTQSEYETFIRKFFTLADQDFEACRTEEDQRKVWTATLAVCVDHFNGLEIETTSLHALHTAIINNALGRPSGYKVTGPVQGTKKPVDEEFVRSLFYVLWKEFPDSREALLVEIHEAIGMNKLQATKFIDNLEREQIGDRTTHRLIDTAKQWVGDSGSFSLFSYI